MNNKIKKFDGGGTPTYIPEAGIMNFGKNATNASVKPKAWEDVSVGWKLFPLGTIRSDDGTVDENEANRQRRLYNAYSQAYNDAKSYYERNISYLKDKYPKADDQHPFFKQEYLMNMAYGISNGELPAYLINDYRGLDRKYLEDRIAYFSDPNVRRQMYVDNLFYNHFIKNFMLSAPLGIIPMGLFGANMWATDPSKGIYSIGDRAFGPGTKKAAVTDAALSALAGVFQGGLMKSSGVGYRPSSWKPSSNPSFSANAGKAAIENFLKYGQPTVPFSRLAARFGLGTLGFETVNHLVKGLSDGKYKSTGELITNPNDHWAKRFVGDVVSNPFSYPSVVYKNIANTAWNGGKATVKNVGKIFNNLSKKVQPINYPIWDDGVYLPTTVPIGKNLFRKNYLKKMNGPNRTLEDYELAFFDDTTDPNNFKRYKLFENNNWVGDRYMRDSDGVKHIIDEYDDGLIRVQSSNWEKPRYVVTTLEWQGDKMVPKKVLVEDEVIARKAIDKAYYTNPSTGNTDLLFQGDDGGWYTYEAPEKLETRTIKSAPSDLPQKTANEVSGGAQEGNRNKSFFKGLTAGAKSQIPGLNKVSGEQLGKWGMRALYGLGAYELATLISRFFTEHGLPIQQELSLKTLGENPSLIDIDEKIKSVKENTPGFSLFHGDRYLLETLESMRTKEKEKADSVLNVVVSNPQETTPVYTNPADTTQVITWR